MNHIVDISTQPARLRTSNGLLCIELEQGPQCMVPLAEIAAVVLGEARVTLTQPVLAELAGAGVPVVICDDRHLPVAMSLPLTGYHAPARRLAAQAAAALPLRKRLWQQIVRAKITVQARLLRAVRGQDLGLPELARAVRSGDPENLEGQAARIYWPCLFHNPDFLRRFDRQDQNRYLNYGYAVLRAVVARAICAAGLHPGLGLHHHHRENPFCLADDLMEPLRPVVDLQVLQALDVAGPDAPLTGPVKRVLLAIVSERYLLEGESRTLFDIAAAMASSLALALERQREDLLLPEVWSW
jgi:CRISPR-associated protein Cas1